MSTVNYLTSRSSNLAAFNTIQLNVSTLTGSTIQTTATATTSSIIVSTLSTRAATYSTLTGSTITTSSIITPVIATATGFTTIGQNTSFPNRSIEIGSDAANSVYFDFHSSDSVYADYSTRIQSVGGSTIGQGHMMIQASTINIVGTSGVGIGTSTPLTTLNIYNTTADSTRGPDVDNRAGQLTISNSKTGTSVYSMAIGMDQVFGIGYINAAGNNTMQPVCLNTRGGNVGIGTTNPTGKCHIYGGGQSTGTGDVYSLNVSSVDSFNGNGAITVYSESINLKAGDLTWSSNTIRVHGARIYIGGGYSINGAQNQGYIGMYTGNVERVRFTDTGISFSGTNHIHFGYDVAGKEANAGKMGYQVFTAGALDIVGAGTGGRTVKIWDSLTVQTSIGIGTATPNITLDAWGTNNGIGRARNIGSQHDADKRDTFYIGRWDGAGGVNEFTGMRCNVDTFTNAGFGAYNNQAWISFYTWGNNNFGTAECLRIRGDGNIMFNRYTSNGTLVAASSNGLITVSSDRRIKEDIVYVEDTVAALDQINHLKPATFRFIGQHDIYLGFIAQDVEQYIPLAVDGKKHEYQWQTDDKGKPLIDEHGNLVYQLDNQGEKIIRPRGLTDRAIIAVQTLAIQELSKTATSSATQIQELSKKVDTLIARLNAAGIA